MASSSSAPTTPSPSFTAHIPLPPSGDSPPNVESNSALVPIHIVTTASQLPPEFLEPSPQDQFIIGFDCEGEDLCRTGALCLIQLAFPDAIYLVDAIEGGEALIKACKPALESNFITKVIHDCKRDSEALYFQFDIKLNKVMDTQIAYALIDEQEGKRKRDDNISFVDLLADPRFCGISYDEKEEVRVLLRQDPKFWRHRPFSERMVRTATDDVRFLLYVYHRMMVNLNERSLWHLAVRGALYCRCFCVNNNDYADWPSLPPIPAPILEDFLLHHLHKHVDMQHKHVDASGLLFSDALDTLKVDGNDLEEEILLVVDIPRGMMGRVIGRRGATILTIKEGCNAEIVIGGSKGPPDKVFIIGPVKQVLKAAALIRGRIMDI